MVQLLAAQCADGSGGFTETNIGSRTVQAYANLQSSLSAYGGCHGTLNGIHVIESTGDDIYNTVDNCRLSSKSGSGDKTLIARVDQLENTNAWARAGIMIREGTANNARNVAVFVTPGNGLIFQSRTSTGGSTATNGTVASIKAPVWLKLAYVGGVTRAYYGTDGATWTQIGSGSVSMSISSYQDGIAAASRSNYPNTSVYSNLSGF